MPKYSSIVEFLKEHLFSFRKKSSIDEDLIEQIDAEEWMRITLS